MEEGGKGGGKEVNKEMEGKEKNCYRKDGRKVRKEKWR